MKIFSTFPLNVNAILFLSCIILFSGCNRNTSSAPGAFGKDDSYAFGIVMANEFSGMIDHNPFITAIRDSRGDGARFTADEAQEMVMAALGRFQTERMEQSQVEDPAEIPAPETFDEDTSYAFGVLIVSDASFDMIEHTAFIDGFKAFSEAARTRFSLEEAQSRVNTAFARVQEEMAAKSLEEGSAYLAENAARAGVTVTASGLQFEVLTEGSGPKPVSEDTVRVHYEGTLTDGTVFDSSYQRGEPAEFPVGMVIPGWVEGLQLMGVGSTYRFVIPSDLAYGPMGGGSVIPPNAVLVFQVELLDIITGTTGETGELR